jgi:crotonobetainyl-CoA:carnitine CoA-transferase CaiB-like acyl-CoA transferase
VGDMLGGVRVVTIEAVGVVPGATGLMSDMGATVIKVEPPGGETGRGNWKRQPELGESFPGGTFFDIRNRGKQSITLNIAKPEGRDVLIRLLANADVFAHNLRASAVERYGLDYGTIGAMYPSLIYAGFSGYGEQGLDRDKDGWGPVALWARAGLGAHFGDVGSMPEPTRGAMDDTIATIGFLACILGALVERGQSGLGQKVTTSHYQLGMWINTPIGQALAGDKVPEKVGHWDNATRAMYECADGRWLFVHAGRPSHWSGLCEALDRRDLLEDPRFATPADRTTNKAALLEILKTDLRKRPALEWERLITDAGGASGMVYTVEDVINDPQAEANGFFTHYDTPLGERRLLAPPLQYSRTPLKPRGPAPEAGEHTDGILTDAGFNRDEIEAFRTAGVI